MEKEYLYALVITVIVIFVVALIFYTTSTEFHDNVVQIKNEVFGITQIEEQEEYSVSSLNLLQRSLELCANVDEAPCLCNILWDFLPEDYYLVVNVDDAGSKLKVLDRFEALISESDLNFDIGLVFESGDELYCRKLDFAFQSNDANPEQFGIFIDDVNHNIIISENKFNFYSYIDEAYVVNNKIICLVSDLMDTEVTEASSEDICLAGNEHSCLISTPGRLDYKAVLQQNVCSPVALESFDGSITVNEENINNIVNAYGSKIESTISSIESSYVLPISMPISLLSYTDGSSYHDLYFAPSSFEELNNLIAVQYDMCDKYEDTTTTIYCSALDLRDDENKVIEVTTRYLADLYNYYAVYSDVERFSYLAFFSSITLVDNLIEEAKTKYSIDEVTWNQIISMLDSDILLESYGEEDYNWLGLVKNKEFPEGLDSESERSTYIKDLVRSSTAVYNYRLVYSGEAINIPSTTLTLSGAISEEASLDPDCLATVINKYGSWIEQYANQYAVPAGMIAATISWESACGAYEKKAGYGGCVGLGQFCSLTAYDYGLCDMKDCSGIDNRVDAEKSIEAIAHYLDNLMNQYSRYSLAERFSYASYNAGSGVVLPVIAQAKSTYNTDDPTWEQFISELDASDISYFSGQAAIDKVEEIKKHNTQIYGYRVLYDETY